jgi:hypothetical protein
VFPFFNGTESEGREVFKAFYDIGRLELAIHPFLPVMLTITPKGPLDDKTGDLPYEQVNSLLVCDLIPSL